ncbi:hypothetical protein PV326_011463 [Microctonus aethiopoides]|nr:hypothetical protein PV326_011463 [Microctonus aethiopoides]
MFGYTKDTFAEKTKKLKLLENEDHVLTLDSDEEFHTKATEIEYQVRKKLLQNQSKTLIQALKNKEPNIAEQEDKSDKRDVDPIKIHKCNDFESSSSNNKPELMSATWYDSISECINLGTPIEFRQSIIYDQDVITRSHNSVEEFRNETKIMLNKILNNLSIIMQCITSDKEVDYLEKLCPVNNSGVIKLSRIIADFWTLSNWPEYGRQNVTLTPKF